MKPQDSAEPSQANKVSGLLWLLATIALALVFAAGYPALVKLIPFSFEKKLSTLLPANLFRECKASPGARAALTQLQTRLFPRLSSDSGLEIQLHLTDDPTVNAFAYLAGSIYINSGLLKEAHSADEVAGVLAHEIAHVENRDVLQGVFGRLILSIFFIQLGDSGATAGVLHQIMAMKFTSQQEAAADRQGLIRLQAAHISAQGFADLFSRLEKSSAGVIPFSDHPDPGDRAALARAVVTKDATPALTDPDWRALKTACLQ